MWNRKVMNSQFDLSSCLQLIKTALVRLSCHSVSVANKVPVTMSSFLQDFYRNILFANKFLRLLNQPINFHTPRFILAKIFHLWPIWYNSFVVAGYIYLIFGQSAPLEIFSQQLWTVMTIFQVLAKLTNRRMHDKEFQTLLKWCEEKYTLRFRPEYQEIVDDTFLKTNRYITLFIRYVGPIYNCVWTQPIKHSHFRLNALLLLMALGFFVLQPIYLGNRATPILIAFNGEVHYYSIPVFLTIYLGQAIHGSCVVILVCGYDAIFIQAIMQITIQYRIMRNTLGLLKKCDTTRSSSQRDVLVHLWKLHTSSLRLTEPTMRQN